MEAPVAVGAPRMPGATTVDTLAQALEGEIKLLNDLASILRRQREGVAADDVQMVDDSVFAAHRIMRTIEEARRRRRNMTGILLADDVPVRELEQALGARTTPALASAVGQLNDAADALAREIDINRRVLRGAIDAGDRVVRALTGASAGPVSYDATARTTQTPAGGRSLFNQQV